MEPAALVTNAIDAFNDQRWDDVAAAYNPDAVIDYPQSGERVVGRASIRGMVEAFPSAPRFVPRRIHGAGPAVIVEVDADYGTYGLWKGIFIYLVDADSIVHETAYFAAPFEAAEWRQPFVEMRTD